VLTGSKKEEGKIERIMAMARKKGVKRMVSAVDVPRSAVFYMISKYSLMVSNDTGPMHVSASLGVKTIGLFGPNMPVRFGPFPPEKNIAIYHKQECSPCINVHKSEFRKCPYHGKCMKAISVDEVFEAASKYL
jgi:heptosyltransferase-2